MYREAGNVPRPCGNVPRRSGARDGGSGCAAGGPVNVPGGIVRLPAPPAGLTEGPATFPEGRGRETDEVGEGPEARKRSIRGFGRPVGACRNFCVWGIYGEKEPNMAGGPFPFPDPSGRQASSSSSAEDSPRRPGQHAGAEQPKRDGGGGFAGSRRMLKHRCSGGHRDEAHCDHERSAGSIGRARGF